MAGSVYKVKDVILSVRGSVSHFDRTRLYGYSALTLKIHIIEELFLHIAIFYGVCSLKKSIREGGFTVVDMRYNREISYDFLIYTSVILHFGLHKLKIKT